MAEWELEIIMLLMTATHVIAFVLGLTLGGSK